MSDYLKDLNPEQYQAATTLNGFIRIIAGAGTGKTSTLTARTAYMIDSGVVPSNILLVTFTKKAAGEMASRICKAIGPTGEQITATTFHSFCANVLRPHAHLLGYKTDFIILDSMDSSQLMKMAHDEVFAEARKNKEPGIPAPSDCMEIYSIASNELMDIKVVAEAYFEEQGAEALFPGFLDDTLKAIKIYNKFKFDRNMMDYDDLLFQMYRLLSEHETVRAGLDNHFKYIMCDEYQDTNIVQDKILDLLSRDIKNLCVVGDDNQSIYRFRGARIENILEFDKRYTPCKTIVLNRNYRSTQEILDVANAVMGYAYEGIPKELKGLTNGRRPGFVITRNQPDEAAWVTQMITGMLRRGDKPSDIAVLVRQARQSYQLEQSLGKCGIPFVKVGGPSFFELSSVNTVLAFVRVAASLTDELAWNRVLCLLPGVGSKGAAKIYNDIVKLGLMALKIEKHKGKIYEDWMHKFCDTIEEAGKEDPQTQVLKFRDLYLDIRESVIKSSTVKDTETKKKELADLHNAADDLLVLARMAGEFKTVKGMLEDFVLNTPAPETDEDRVVISTIHSAKGLEWKTVFLYEPIQGVLPHTADDCPDTREDLRCLYVALTRAKKSLCVVVPQMKSVYTKYNAFAEQPAEISVFLDHEDVLDKFNISRI